MKLKFKKQQFQIDAVQAVVDCFKGQPIKTNRFTLERSQEIIRKTKQAAQGVQEIGFEIEEAIGYRNSTVKLMDSQVLENIQSVQGENDILESAQIERPKGVKDGFNLTVEMETGTGKTYTYIRTMYELQKKYGWSKYIVIVPSVAIREGVYKTFEVTQDHFQELYGQKIAPFIYNSSRPQDVENFASDSRISVMIINTQAFNKKHSNVMHEESDRFGSRKPIEIISQTNPILIIDEPQSVDGPKTLASMQEFKPLFSLRYSATHKVDYNMVYRLDALDSYNQKLVKKIQVKGITVKGIDGTGGYLYLEEISLSTTKPPFAVMEFEERRAAGPRRIRKKLEQGASLYELSGNMPQYKNMTIQEIDGYKNLVVVGGEKMSPGQILNDPNEAAFRRVQIRECIKSHIEKERSLFTQGIKVLSLFFIDSVEKYRVYDEQGEAQLGEYARVFQEEYEKIVSGALQLDSPEYNAYLQRDEASQVHNGYFSIDKKGKSVESKLKRGEESANNDDAERAYDLIMKEKEQLLSLEEPVRFIFSHSALKEGWDNPNVFQICALKNVEGGSETRRRQEVGRGMRLCVDKDGIRQDFQTIGDRVHEVNKLTVIASESYEDFAKGLQNEIAKTLRARPTKANEDFFIERMVVNEQGEQYRLTSDDARKLSRELIREDIIDDNDKVTTEGKEKIEQGAFSVPEHLEPYKASIQKLLQTIWTGEEMVPEDERKRVVLTTNENFNRKEFKELWNKINLRTIYEVQFDSAKLIEDSRNKINGQLFIQDLAFEVRTGELQESTKQDLEEGDAFRVQESQMQQISQTTSTNAVYDLVGEIESITHLTRRTIVEILKAIKEEKFLLFRKNPEEFIQKVGGLINEVKASLIVNNIVYHKTEDRHEATTVFTNDKTALRQSEQLHKHIYNFLTTDSQIEASFAQELEVQDEVVVYAKLPKSFFVPTPVANYSPDWAIVINKDTERHVYFVAETKGSDSDQDLREIEKLKIHCAEQHFEAIGDKKVVFKKVANYDTLRATLAEA